MLIFLKANCSHETKFLIGFRALEQMHQYLNCAGVYLLSGFFLFKRCILSVLFRVSKRLCCAVLCCASPLCCFATLWTVARQAPLSMGIFQAGILEWDLPNPWNQGQVSHIAGGFFIIWATCKISYIIIIIVKYITANLKKCFSKFSVSLSYKYFKVIFILYCIV